MRYQVREPGKTGGTIYPSIFQAIDARNAWFYETGILCELWVEGSGNWEFVSFSAGERARFQGVSHAR